MLKTMSMVHQLSLSNDSQATANFRSNDAFTCLGTTWWTYWNWFFELGVVLKKNRYREWTELDVDSLERRLFSFISLILEDLTIRLRLELIDVFTVRRNTRVTLLAEVHDSYTIDSYDKKSMYSLANRNKGEEHQILQNIRT